MRQLTLIAPGIVEWIDVPAPSLSSDRAALVRPLVAATCDFDHLLVSGRVPLGYPIPLGHEAVGVVTQVGADVATVQPGDHVIVPFQVSCGECRKCIAGLTSSCEAVPWLSGYGLGEVGGGYGGLVADLAEVPYADAMLLRLASDVDPVVAPSLSCNLVDAYRCVVPPLSHRPRGRVLITGGTFDSIALYAAKLAECHGAEEVLLVAPGSDLQQRAEAVGVRSVSKWTPELGHFDITVDASMHPQLLVEAIEATAPSGILTVSTMYPGSPSPLPLMTMFERGITVFTGQPHVRATLDEVVALVRDGFDVAALTTEVLDWDQAPRAFTRGTGKRVIAR